MAQFKYTAMTRGGQKVTGLVDGFNEMDAAVRIKENYDIILKLNDVSEKGPGFLNFDLGGQRLNNKAFTVMCSQFAIILKSGLPIARAVHLIGEKTTDKTLKTMLEKVAADVEGGRALSASFEEHGGKFLPPTFFETIRAGEETGNIDHAFETMYEHFDKQVKLNAKVRAAIAYPLFVLVLAVVVVTVLMIVVVPIFVGVFDEFDAEIPAMTRFVMNASTFLKNNILYIIFAIALIVLGIRLYGKSEKGRTNLAKLALKMPVFGQINTLSAASQFANSMATMLQSGLPLVKSVNITAKTLSNYYLSTETGLLSGELEAGRTLNAAMREQGLMPDILTDMVGVGEETGELGDTLSTIALYYDAELENSIQRALSKLEPTLLIIIAGFVGFIVFAMYSSMFSMYGAMSG